MAFGQHPGRPANARQLRRLGDLILAAGHTGFRDARGPLGLTQRQAAGRFTGDEADDLIARLEAELAGAPAPAIATPGPPQVLERRTPASSGDPHELDLAAVPAELLAAELQRRGWVVMGP
jgi:hypothetical protein